MSVCVRVLCETVKDFVARVGKAYEKNTESSEESEAMAKKVQHSHSCTGRLVTCWLQQSDTDQLILSV